MQVNILKIRPKFINLIRDNRKKFEYRLATPERKNIKVGDVLVLVSNQNKEDFIKVIVTDKKILDSWEEIIEQYWQIDLTNHYESKETALEECRKFYSRDQIRQFGIIIFTITPFLKDIKKSNILLDTNVIVRRESFNNVSFEVTKLFNHFDKLNIKRFIHPLTIEELSKHKNEEIRKSMLTKINCYNKLIPFETTDPFFDKEVSNYPKDENSVIDNNILFQVYSRRVDFLITDDNIIHLKARNLYLEDSVFTTEGFLRFIEEKYPDLIDYPVLSIKLKKFGEIKLSDPFFDSLREDYNGIEFDKWFIKKNNEEAYVYEDDTGIKGFLYLKTEDNDENYSDIIPPFTKKKRLKVGTFKINAQGLRISERFIKIILDNASKRNVDEIYVTLFEDKRDEVKALNSKLVEWGFNKYGRKTNGEIVLVRNVGVYDNSKTIKENYPLFSDTASYGFLPIMSDFHTDLFPDLYLKNEDYRVYSESAHSYALEKIYICGRAYNYSNKPGDILVIYRMGADFTYKKYSSVVTGIAILEAVYYPNEMSEMLKICKNRSVFNEEKIKSFVPSKCMIIKLIYLKAFNKKITLNDLRNYGIIDPDGGARLTTPLDKSKYELICKLAEG